MSKEQKSKLKKITGMVFVFIAIPLLMYIGMKIKFKMNYYLTSTLIIICSIIPFFFKFEKRHPATKEIVIIAVMCAIAVTSRIAFFFVPQFKPIVAIIIITAIAFGKEAGFLTGSISMFVSNIFFGQGPWTAWQMFAAGIIGYLAGAIFFNKYKLQNILTICIYGGLATFIIYGGLLNFSTYLMVVRNHNLKSLIAIYITGIPFDLIHSTSTIIFLCIGVKPILKKLTRIKIKYGLI